MKPGPTVLLVLSIFIFAGCVSINQGVDLKQPGEINTPKSIAAQCTPQAYPNQILRMHGNAGSKAVTEGWRAANSQEEFDPLWASLTLDPGQSLNTTVEGTSKPFINWTNQTVFFAPVRVDNTCQRIVPIGMETNCLRVIFDFANFSYQKDCQPVTEFPVYLFILPRTALPMEAKWLDDADKDGFSNDSEVKVGTDPLNADSHP